jgi:hypothetical protein
MKGGEKRMEKRECSIRIKFVTLFCFMVMIIFLVSVILLSTYASPENPISPKHKQLEKPGRYHEFPSKVLSEELVNYTVSYSHETKLYKVVTIMEKPKLEQLIENSRDWFDFLKSKFGEAGKQKVEEQVKRWRDWLNSRPEVIIEEVSRIVAVDNSIQFNNALFESPNFNPEDPINLIFWAHGSASDVNYDMQNWLTNKWGGNALGSDLYAFIDKNHADNLDWTWKKQDYQLDYPPWTGVVTTRYHIRIFDSGYDQQKFYWWSIAGVHHEYFCGLGHIVDDWEGAESFVRNDFSSKWFVGAIVYVNLYNAGNWQNVYNDGWATLIELKA